MQIDDKYNFTINQGDTFKFTASLFTLSNATAPIIGYKARFVVKEEIDHDNLLIDVNSEDDVDNIIVDEVNGKVSLSFTPVETAALNFETAIYNILIYNDTDTHRILQGVIRLSKGVI